MAIGTNTNTGTVLVAAKAKIQDKTIQNKKKTNRAIVPTWGEPVD